jgi:hypothetical protein
MSDEEEASFSLFLSFADVVLSRGSTRMLRTLAVFAYLKMVTCLAAPPPICWEAVKANARHTPKVGELPAICNIPRRPNSVLRPTLPNQT